MIIIIDTSGSKVHKEDVVDPPKKPGKYTVTASVYMQCL